MWPLFQTWMEHRRRRLLGYRLLFWILLFSSLITLGATGLQLWLDYDRDVSLIHERLDEIRKSRLQGLVNSLWDINEAQTRTLLKGVSQLPDVSLVAIHDENGRALFRIGLEPAGQSLTRTFPLVFVDPREKVAFPLGRLQVEASLEGVYQRLEERVFIILGSQAVKTFLMSLLILLIVQRIVSRRLRPLADFTRRFSLENLDAPLNLDLAPRNRPPDELEEVGQAMEQMRRSLKQDIDRRREVEDEMRRLAVTLEHRVEERTASLTRANRDLEREVREHLTTQEELARQTAFQKTVLEHIEDGILTCNPAGRFTLTNRATSSFFPLPEEEAPPESWPDAYHLYQEDGETLLKSNEVPLYRALRGETVERFQMMVKPKGRKPRMLVVKAQPLTDSGGNNLGALATLHDITEQTGLEERLRQSQKLEAIGALAGGIAHDFNNILGVVMGYAEMGISKLPDDHPAHPFQQEILTASLRARDLVAQLLTFSRRGGVNKKPIILNSLVKESMKFLRGALPADIQIGARLPREDLVIQADPTQIHQVLMNLFSNASHALKETGGTVELTMEEINLSPTRARTLGLSPGPHVRLAVRDDGPGMSPEVKERIFDPFFTTKPVGEGTGLGLSVIHGIVTDAEGAIHIDSQPGKGTCCEVFFPPASLNPYPERSAPDAPSPRGSGRILFVDDEASLVRLGATILTHLGYKVVGKTNPLDALTTYEADPDGFDAVITDHAMPKLNGTKLLERIKALNPKIPVILCTGRPLASILNNMGDSPFDGFLQKPVGSSDLAQTLAHLLPRT